MAAVVVDLVVGMEYNGGLCCTVVCCCVALMA